MPNRQLEYLAAQLDSRQPKHPDLMSDYSLEPPINVDLTGHDSPTLVTARDPRWMREMVEVLARYARKERRYNGTLFDANETPGHDDFYPYEVYLFHETAWDQVEEDIPVPTRAIGAVCLRHIGSKDEPIWTMQWAWFHPFARARGLLSDFWPELKAKYGDFTVQSPLSSSMKAFLATHGEPIPPA